MKELKPVVYFLLRLLVVYGLLLVAYNWYLSGFLQEQKPDNYTKFVASNVVHAMNFFEPNSTFGQESKQHLSVFIYYKNKYISHVNEGCNAISVMIIFVAIMAGFYTKLVPTLCYIIGGLLFLFVMNIVRIVLLNYTFFYWSDYGKMMHDYLFPAVIYGSVVILWLVWIRFFIPKKA